MSSAVTEEDRWTLDASFVPPGGEDQILRGEGEEGGRADRAHLVDHRVDPRTWTESVESPGALARGESQDGGHRQVRGEVGTCVGDWLERPLVKDWNFCLFSGTYHIALRRHCKMVYILNYTMHTCTCTYACAFHVHAHSLYRFAWLRGLALPFPPAPCLLPCSITTKHAARMDTDVEVSTTSTRRACCSE